MISTQFILSRLTGIRMLVLLFILVNATGYAQEIRLEFSKGEEDKIPTTFHSISPAQFTKGTSFWLRVTVTAKEDQTMILKAGNWYMQQVSFFDTIPKLIGRGNHLEVSLKKGNNLFYLFYPFHDDKDKNGVSVTLSATEDFNREYLVMRVWQTVFASIIGLLFLMSASYSLIVRSDDGIYARYAIYLLTILIFFAYQYGLLGDTVPVIKLVPPAWLWIFSDFITITYLYFSQSFLDMRKTDPWLHKIFNFGIYLVASMAVIETISYLVEVDVLHSIWFKGPIFLFELIIFPIIFYRIYKQGTVLSWVFLISIIILGAANLAGQFSSTFKAVSATNNLIQIGMLTDAFLFSIGIGIRFGIINREKQGIQNDLIQQMKINEGIQKKNAAELEMKVNERTEALNKRNHENELLIKEIHHRVKNNLQVVSSLLNIAERKVSDENAKQPFRDSANRINSMGLIHSFLYQNENFCEIDLEKYIRQLTDMLADSFRAKYPHLEIKLNVGPVKLDMDSAIEIGLIINELLTNSLKHGVYADNKPVIQLSILQDKRKLKLNVGDNGFLNGHQKINMEASFGMRMISALVKKQNGTLNIQQTNGFEVMIELDNAEKGIPQ